MYVGENYIPKANENFIRFVVYGPVGKLAQPCPLSMVEKLPKGVMILPSCRCSNLKLKTPFVANLPILLYRSKLYRNKLCRHKSYRHDSLVVDHTITLSSHLLLWFLS